MLSLIKRSAELARGTEAGSKSKVGAMLLEHNARELRLRPIVLLMLLTLSMRNLILCLQMINRLF